MYVGRIYSICNAVRVITRYSAILRCELGGGWREGGSG